MEAGVGPVNWNDYIEEHPDYFQRKRAEDIYDA